MLPKWYFPDTYVTEPIGRILPGFYEEDDNTIDVIFLGASKLLFGISPMELYEKYGYATYNLSTNGQPIEVSYFMLKEALKTQKPRLLVLDVTGLYRTDASEENWRYLIDYMPISINKIFFAKELSKQYGNEKFFSTIFPIVKYHERWEELTQKDFTDWKRNKKFYSKGYYVLSRQMPASFSEEQINEWAELLSHEQSATNIGYNNDNYFAHETENHLYDTNIPQEKIIWLEKIKEVCKDNDIKLLLLNVPALNSPTKSYNAWSNIRSDKAKELCQNMQIEFFDIQYDSNIDIDWTTDTRDAGDHLNLLGAIKTTAVLGEYMAKYNLPQHKIKTWDEDLMLYMQLKSIALTQMQNDFIQYINDLTNKYNDKTIIMACSNDITAGLTYADKMSLKMLGLKADFSDSMHTNAYIAIIEKGKIVHEEWSNRKLYLDGKLDNGAVYNIISSGWPTSPNAEIKINGNSYSKNGYGLNIVIYDGDKDIVLDSVCFNTNTFEKTASRNSYTVSRYLVELEAYLIENGI